MKFSLPNLRRATTLGIEIVDNRVRVAEVSKVGSSYLIENAAIAPLPPDTVVDGAVVNKKTLSLLVKELLKKNRIKRSPVVLCLPVTMVLVKHITLPVSSRDAIKKIIVDDFHIYFHFHNSDEAYFDFAITDKSKENDTEILLVASKREIVDDYLLALKDAGLSIAAVSAGYFALQNLFEINHGIDESVKILVSVDSLTAIINIVKGEKLLLAHDVSLQDGEEIPLILSEELERALTYYNSSKDDEAVERIFVTGEMCSDALLELLAKSTGLPVQMISSFSNGLALSKKAQHRESGQTKLVNELAICIGAAIGDDKSYG